MLRGASALSKRDGSVSAGFASARACGRDGTAVGLLLVWLGHFFLGRDRFTCSLKGSFGGQLFFLGIWVFLHFDSGRGKEQPG